MEADSPRIQLIHTLGGPHSVARQIGKRPGAVRMWVQRDLIPRTAWPDLIDAFPDLTLEKLKLLEAA